MKRFTRVLAVLLIGAVLPALASNDKAAKVLFQKGSYCIGKAGITRR